MRPCLFEGVAAALSTVLSFPLDLWLSLACPPVCVRFRRQDNIPDRIVKAIDPFIAMPEFQPDAVEKASKVPYISMYICMCICVYVCVFPSHRS